MQNIPQGYVEVNRPYFNPMCNKYVRIQDILHKEELVKEYNKFKEQVAFAKNMNPIARWFFAPQYAKVKDDSYESFEKNAYCWFWGGKIVNNLEQKYNQRKKIPLMFLSGNMSSLYASSVIIALEEYNKIMKTVEEYEEKHGTINLLK